MSTDVQLLEAGLTPTDVEQVGAIVVLNEDCLETLIREHQPMTAMLCMASDYHPGGGVKKGCEAQEEHLCRHSTLYTRLMKVTKGKKEFKLYPITTPFILPDVTFFSHIDPLKDKCKNLTTDITCAIIMSSAVRVRNGSGFTKEDIRDTETRIRSMIQLCANHGYRHLILSAFGCGAFKNPPQVVSQLFYQVLVTENYRRFFEKVTFSILGDNYQVFHKAFA